MRSGLKTRQRISKSSNVPRVPQWPQWNKYTLTAGDGIDGWQVFRHERSFSAPYRSSACRTKLGCAESQGVIAPNRAEFSPLARYSLWEISQNLANHRRAV